MYWTTLCFTALVLFVNSGGTALEFKQYTGDDLQKARESALKWHNIFRGWHNASGEVPLLEMTDELNTKAQEVSKFYKPGIGENKYESPISTNTTPFNVVEIAERAVKEWYYEVCDEKSRKEEMLNHFTAIVWMETNTMGFGVSVRSDNRQYRVTALYDTVGNFPGEYETNVKPLRCPISEICNGLKPKYEFKNSLEETACAANKHDDKKQTKGTSCKLGKKACKKP